MTKPLMPWETLVAELGIDTDLNDGDNTGYYRAVAEPSRNSLGIEFLTLHYEAYAPSPYRSTRAIFQLVTVEDDDD